MNKQKLLIAFFIMLHINMLHSMEQDNLLVIDKSKLPHVHTAQGTQNCDDTRYDFAVEPSSFLLLLMEASDQARKTSSPQFLELLEKIKQEKITPFGNTKIKIGDQIRMGITDETKLTQKDFCYRLLTNIYQLGGQTLEGSFDDKTPIIIKNKIAYLVRVSKKYTYLEKTHPKITWYVKNFSSSPELTFDPDYYERKAEVKKILDDYSALSDKRP